MQLLTSAQNYNGSPNPPDPAFPSPCGWIKMSKKINGKLLPFIQGGTKKIPNFILGITSVIGNSAPILTILSLLQAEIYGT